MKKLLPIILIVLGLGGGVGAGLVMRPVPDPEPEEATCADEACEKEPEPVLVRAEPEEVFDPEAAREYAKLGKQFVVPIVKKERVRALVVLSITLEVEPGTTDAVFGREPKLRDAFLQVLFEHANTGGFDGAFTTGESMRDLRGALREVARRSAGGDVHDVLITEMVKQAM